MRFIKMSTVFKKGWGSVQYEGSNRIVLLFRSFESGASSQFNNLNLSHLLYFRLHSSPLILEVHPGDSLRTSSTYYKLLVPECYYLLLPECYMSYLLEDSVRSGRWVVALRRSASTLHL